MQRFDICDLGCTYYAAIDAIRAYCAAILGNIVSAINAISAYF